MKNLQDEKLMAGMAIEKFLQKDPTYKSTLGLSGGEVRLVPVTHIVTAKVTGTNIEFVKSGITKEVGVKTFNNKALEAGKPLILCAVSAHYAKEATADNKTVATADYSDVAPAGLVNGELTISQQGRGNLVDAQFSALINQNATQNNLDQEFDIADMPIIKSETEIDIVGKLPEAIATAGNDDFVRIALRGYTIQA
ncbi:hypothetical protein [Aurantibacter aestuarii]|uniref:Uncharacterized protein n=1 Tax=Aurantibacter aestuarii TaxID=1266046 RepID=A0A2T1NEK2_9FLAO|nr:hypothetical protein [Aurantibacter aestuarii]PSG90882.1 hypothetical protein C7H52_06305 [Aurantibacter aestuarii]